MFRGVDARGLWIAIAGIALVATVGTLTWYLLRLDNYGAQEGVGLVGFSAESTGTVAFAGQFPMTEEAPLGGPMGMDQIDDRLYIALSEIGAIGVFSLDGAMLDTITIEPVSGAPVSYPIDVAAISSDRLAVVETSGNRVILLDPSDPTAARPLLSESAPSLGQPTAVEYHDGELFVADATSGMIHVYDGSGEPLRQLGAGMIPPITYVGAMHLAGSTLWVSDSNLGRVLGLDPFTGQVLRSVQMRFDLPRGIVSDEAGRIYVAEAFAGVVRVFDSEGLGVLDIVGDEALHGFTSEAAMTSPKDVWWDANESRLYVSDAEQGRIKVYNVREEVE